MGISRFEAAGSAACESENKKVAEGAESSVDFAMATRTARRNESVSFADDDEDMIERDDRGRTVSFARSAAERLDYS